MNQIRIIQALFLSFFIFFAATTNAAEVKSKSISSKTLLKFTQTDSLGSVSDVTLNGREFSSFDDRTISFYKDDIDKDHQITISGFLDSDSDIPVEQLSVEITTDGGESWTKAQGHNEWSWSFEPELAKEYDFGLRVVLDDESVNDLLGIPNTLSIGGFTLTLGSGCSITDGKISGLGTINIPYLDKISALTSTEINVNFENLSFADGVVNLGDITYNEPFTIETPLGAVGISSIVFSPTPANNKITGAIVFNGPLESIPSVSLPEGSKFLPTSFDLNIPFNGEVINIWEEKDVDLVISSGNLNIAYTAGANSPTASLDLPSANFRLGSLLRDATNAINSVNFDLTSPSGSITLNIPSGVSLLDTGITMPQAFDLTLDLSDFANPSISFSTSVDMTGYDNVIANALENASIDATVTKTGMSATISSTSQLNPVTIIDRGTDAEDVRLIFTGDSPSFTITINNDDLTPSFELGSISAELHFGNLLTTAQNSAGNIIATIADISAPSINISQSMYLLGSKINLPNGFNANVDLSDLSSPVISFNDIDIDFSNYDNFVAKQISNAKISATISKDGFIASVTSDKPSPIDIYAAQGVKLKFLGETGPTFSININGTDSLPEFSISDIDAELDFGTLLKSTIDETQNVIASIGVITEDEIESLNLTLPAKVKLLESNFALEGIVSTLNLSNKEISIASSADLSAYTNPVLKALSGAKVDATISTSGFAGTITLDDELEPISIWSEKQVTMQINGTPSFSVEVTNGDVSFDFAELSASINFGSLLKTVSGESILASLSSSMNEAGEYSANIVNKAYILGSSFALSDTDIYFNPNSKNITISSTADLSAHTNPVVKAFDSASFSATISTSGFSGSLSKNSGFEPIVVLNRGGEGKDVSIEFTSSPTISVSILNSGIDFGISGGSADLHFGDFLNQATAQLQSIADSTYSWSIDAKTKLYKDAKAYVQGIEGSLDIADISNPKISFGAKVDLSEYGGILEDVKDATLNNATISKDGFSADLSASLGTVNIWKAKNVSITFNEDPTINLALNTSGFNISFSQLNAGLNFGDLLDNAVATLSNVVQEGESVIDSVSYTWYVEGEYALYNSEILLSSLGGSIDLSDFSNPIITLSASADLSDYGSVFDYVTNADLENVTISKSGFSGTLATTLSEIPIWREKGVKVSFNTSPKFYLNIDSSGLKVGASDLSANVHLGSLIGDGVNEVTASLTTLQNDIYTWSISGENVVNGTNLFLSDLAGELDFSDLKDPSIKLDATVKVDGLGEKFKALQLRNGLITKSSFEGDLSVALENIDIYTEGSKEIDLEFIDGTSPTLHIELSRSDFNIGISDLSANLVFTNMLNNQVITLSPQMNLDGLINKGVYTWELDGTHNLLSDSNGVLPITDTSGSIDLNDWTNPVVTFSTTADFTNYNLVSFGNLGVVETQATVHKTNIEWDLTVQNASANFTILDLGTDEQDVRVELTNISGSAGSGSGELTGADGTLFFGALFEGNKQVGLTFQTTDTGLKKYGFSYPEEIVYKKDDDNFVTFTGVEGDVIELSDGSYKVALRGSAVAHSSILNTISVDTLTLQDLEISSSGFAGTLSATWSDYSINILEGHASIILREVGVHIDSSDRDMPIKLATFDGDLDLQEFFDGDDVKAALAFANSNIGWSFANGRVLKINDNFIFKNLNGNINIDSLDSLSIGLSGYFGYEGLSPEVSLSDFTINSSGVAGTASINNVSIFNKLTLTSLSVTFAGVDTSGSAALAYRDSSFLSTGNPLNLNLSATVDKDGIDAFSVDTTGTNLASIDISGFAKFNFTGVTASPSMSNFWVSLDGNVEPKHKILASDVELAFKDLNITQTGISVGGGEVTVETSASASIGGIGFGIDSLGIGFENDLFYIKAIGDLSLVIASIENAEIKVYSDKTYDVGPITLNINQNAFSASGTFDWYDYTDSDDELNNIYGRGFHAATRVTLKNLFSATGEIRIGNTGEYPYWMAYVSGGNSSGIPFGAVNFYEFGGGVASNMLYNFEENRFIPQDNSLNLTLTTKIGTPDSGYMWHGDIRLDAAFVESNMQQIQMSGLSYLLSDLHETPSNRIIDASITYATEPKSLHMTFGADISYKGIKVKGQMDAMFSQNDKHIFIGTDSSYAYAFNSNVNLGHVEVGLFGIDANGFFMVNDSAIAYGMGLHVDKHWHKSWWGPDPSLDFLLDAHAKALLVYRPRFQMNLDIGLEVGMTACYGGCIDLGADVLLKLATPDPDYLWARAGIHIFGTSITFKRYIYGEGALQQASQAPEPDVFDRIEPANDGLGLLPYLKVYSSFSKTQPISVAMNNPTLIDTTTNRAVALTDYVLDSQEQKMGKAYMPNRMLIKNHTYKFSGSITATYGSGDDRETKTDEYEKIFTVTNDDIPFSDIVEYISPKNNEENVHEDSGVTIKYNSLVLSRLGENSEFVKQYVIKLSDSDGNDIVGVFDEVNREYISKFKSIKALRVYKYCVNEEGKVRETYVLDNHYLNPFNGFSVDDGDISQAVLSALTPSTYASNVGAQTTDRMDNPIANSALINTQEDQEQSDSQILTTQINSVNANAREVNTNPSLNIPSYLRLDDIVLKSPEALGELVTTGISQGKRYSYYRANTYNVSVFKKPDMQNPIYRSQFKVRYNNIEAEARRKVEDMQTNLDPTLTVSFDVNRIAASLDGMHIAGTSFGNGFGNSPGNNFNDEVRLEKNSGLEDIGVYTGVKTKVITTWIVRKRDATIATIQKDDNYDRYVLPGVVLEYSARIQYISNANNEVIIEKPMRILVGDPFNSQQERAEEEERRQNVENAVNEAEQSIQDGFRPSGGMVTPGGGLPGGLNTPGGLNSGGGMMRDGAMRNGALNGVGSQINGIGNQINGMGN